MDYNTNHITPPPYYGQGVTVQDTNAIMKRVYVRMSIGLLVSALVALGVASSPAMLSFIFGNQLVFWGMWIAMIVISIAIPVRMQKMSTGAVLGLFLLFSVLMGAALSSIFVVYKMDSIVTAFFVSAGTFGAMSVYGYFTKRDLTKMGTYLIMALFGLIIASIVNIFVASSGLYWVITYAGVLIFVGFTAWDTQCVRRLAQSAQSFDPATLDKLATMSALSLYMDFINLFLYFLRIFGGSSRD